MRRGVLGGGGFRADDRGAVAAEFAVALPALVLVIALGVGALSAGSRQVRLQDAVADAARLAAREEDPGRAAGAVTSAVPGASVEITARGDLVCVSAAVDAPPLPITLRAEGCALAGGL